MTFDPFEAFDPFGGGAALDPDIAAFVAASGATDIAALSVLTSYLKAESLWAHCRIFPFKSAQNKGSGTTVYGLGGWTSNNITTVGGPTWGASGMAFDAVDDRGTVSMTGIEALPELYTFDRQRPVGASLPDNARWAGMSLTSGNSLNWLGWQGGTGLLSGETVDLGITTSAAANGRKGASFSWSAGQDKQIIWLHSSSAKLFNGKVEAASYISSGITDFRPLNSGVNNSTLHVSADNYTGTPQVLPATTRVALLLCKTSLTTPQREAITDYLDAL